MLYTLLDHVLLNHIPNGMILRLGSIILQMVPAAYPTDAMHTWAIVRLVQCLRCYNLALLTLYTPDSISRMLKSGFIDFVKQSAACVAVTIQSTLSPQPGVDLTSAIAIV